QLAVLLGPLDVVEHRQQCDQHVLHAPLPRGLLVAQGTVAVVREAGALPLQGVQVLGGLCLGLEHLGRLRRVSGRLEVEPGERVARLGGGLTLARRRRLLGRLSLGGPCLVARHAHLALVRELEGVLGRALGLGGALLVLVRHLRSSSSSTISASTTSSSGADCASAAWGPPSAPCAAGCWAEYSAPPIFCEDAPSFS